MLRRQMEAAEAEEWRPVAEYEGYFVSNLGRVRSTLRGDKIMKVHISCHGYYQINLRHNSTKASFKVHRLVAEAFVPNPVGKLYVDHIDRNKQNNVVSNLRWVTNVENQENTGLRKSNTSGFKGVSFDHKTDMWRATKSVNRKQIALGYFDTKEEAAEAYRLYHTQ